MLETLFVSVVVGVAALVVEGSVPFSLSLSLYIYIYVSRCLQARSGIAFRCCALLPEVLAVAFAETMSLPCSAWGGSCR